MFGVINLRSTVSNASFAALHCASQLLHPARLETDVLPSFVQRFLDFVGYVDNLRSRDDIVPSVNEAIEDLIEPKTVFCFSIFVQIANLTPVQDLAFTSQ